MNENRLHEPVLLEEVINIMQGHTNVVVDATCGNGGHTLSMAMTYSDSISALYCFDRDSDSLKIAERRLSEFPFVKLIPGSYVFIRDILKEDKKEADFILFDLGLSMWQIKSSGRGFTYRSKEPLDMRFNREKGDPLFVELKRLSPNTLTDILKTYGDVKGAGKIAEFIVKERKRREIRTTQDFTNLLKEIYVSDKEIQKIYMALRIYINDELKELSKGIVNALSVLKKGGIVAFITYHSVEDRMVKKIAYLPGMEKIKPYPIKPTPEEIKKNKSARSAKLRAFIKGEDYAEEAARSVFTAVVSSFPPSPYCA